MTTTDADLFLFNNQSLWTWSLDVTYCDGCGATAHEPHTPAPYLQPLAHPNRHGLHTHAHTNTHTTDYNWIHLMDTANCLDWQRGHGKWSGPGHLDKVVGFTNLSNIILLHSFLFVLWLWRNAMFVSRGLSCHCVLFSVCVYPPCVKMVLAARCIYVHCSVS